MSDKKVKVYIASHCLPCKVVEDSLKKGRFLIDGEEGEVELIDIETDEGYKQIFDGLGSVPAAYLDGKKCKLYMDDDETLILECDE